MSRYLIFIPDQITRPTDAELGSLGIDDLVDRSTWFPVFTSPDGMKPGMACAVGEQLQSAPDLLDKGLRWLRDDGLCYAFDRENPPGPKDLIRNDAAGESLALCDGNDWLIADLSRTHDAVLADLIGDIREFLIQPGWHCGYAEQTYIPGSRLIVRKALRRNYRIPDQLIKLRGLDLVDLPQLALGVIYAIGIQAEIRKHEATEDR